MRKKNFILSLITILFADIIYFVWMPYPKSFIKTVGSSTFVFDIITNAIYFVGFALVLVISVKSIARPGVKLGKKKILISIAAFCLVQFAFDLIKYVLGFYPLLGAFFVNDLFTVIVAFAFVLIINKIAGTKKVNYRKFFAISLPVILIALTVAFILDIRTVHNLMYAADKYTIFSSEIGYIGKNADYLYSVQNFALDFISFLIVMTAFYFSSSPIEIEDMERFHNGSAIFRARILSIIVLSFALCGLKVLILPCNSLRTMGISVLTSHPTYPVFYCDSNIVKIHRSISYSEKKEIYCTTHVKLYYENKRLLDFYIDGECFRPSMEKADVNGTEVAVICTDKAIAYLKEGIPYAIKVSDVADEDYDEPLLGVCEEMLKDGKLGSFEYICEYVLKYDPEFAMPYIKRYIAGDFTDEELENNQSIRTEYISSCARRLAGE